MKYKIVGRWRSDGLSHVYECRGVSQGRMIGRVSVDLDVDAMQDLKTYFGGSSLADVENTATTALQSIIKERYKDAELEK